MRMPLKTASAGLAAGAATRTGTAARMGTTPVKHAMAAAFEGTMAVAKEADGVLHGMANPRAEHSMQGLFCSLRLPQIPYFLLKTSLWRGHLCPVRTASLTSSPLGQAPVPVFVAPPGLHIALRAAPRRGQRACAAAGRPTVPWRRPTASPAQNTH